MFQHTPKYFLHLLTYTQRNGIAQAVQKVLFFDKFHKDA